MKKVFTLLCAITAYLGIIHAELRHLKQGQSTAFEVLEHLQQNAGFPNDTISTTPSIERMLKNSKLITDKIYNLQDYSETLEQDAPVDIQFKQNITLTLYSSDPQAGIVEGDGVYSKGENVTIEAIGKNGYTFEKWSDENTNSIRTIVLEKDTNLTAYFVKSDAQYTVELQGTLFEGRRCAIFSGEGKYTCGTNAKISVSISDKYSDDYRFVMWSDGNKNATRTILVDKDIFLTAIIEQIECSETSGESIDYGQDGHYRYELSDDCILTISGTGDMRDWAGFPDCRECVIKEGITSIGGYAFSDRAIQSISIPSSVNAIKGSAFKYCENLTSITIPNNVKNIEADAFRQCYSLSSVTIGDGLNIIESGTFNSCYSLKSVTIGNSVESIFSGAFYGCHNLESIIIPNTVNYIGSSAFQACGLRKITINNGEIEQNAFNSSNLKFVNIGKDVKDIAIGAFNSPNLTFVTINSNHIVSRDFTNSSYNLIAIFGKQINEVLIGNDVKCIGRYAFYEGRQIQHVTIGKNVTRIGWGAFDYCQKLTSITIPDSVRCIDRYAFSNCIGLESITLGSNLDSIKDEAFNECYHLKSVTVLAPTPPICESKVFKGVFTYGIPLYVPKESIELYKNADVWKDFFIKPVDGIDDEPADTCMLQMEMIDFGGDGWNGSQLCAEYTDGTKKYFTLDKGGVGYDSIPYPSDQNIKLSWINNSSTNDFGCWFSIKNDMGSHVYFNIFNNDDLSVKEELFTIDEDICGKGHSVAPTNLTATLQDDGRYTLSWSPIEGALAYVVTLVDTNNSYVNTCDTILFAHICESVSEWHLERPIYKSGAYFWKVRAVGSDKNDNLVMLGDASSIFEIKQENNFTLNIEVPTAVGFNDERGLFLSYIENCNETIVPMALMVSHQCSKIWTVSIPQPNENTILMVNNADKSQYTYQYKGSLFENDRMYQINNPDGAIFSIGLYPEQIKLNIEVPDDIGFDVSSNGLWINYYMNNEDYFVPAEYICTSLWKATLIFNSGYIPSTLAFCNGNKNSMTQSTPSYCYYQFIGNENYIIGSSDKDKYDIQYNTTPQQKKLQLDIEGKGKIVVSPESENGYYPIGTTIRLEANTEDGSIFDHWVVDQEQISNEKQIEITLDCDRYVIAVFRNISEKYYTLYIEDPSTINIIGEPPFIFKEGTIVSVKHIEDPCYTLKWIVDGVYSSSDELLYIEMNSDHTLRVEKETRCDFSFNISTYPANIGLAKIKDKKNQYCANDIVEIEAENNDCFKFVKWSDGSKDYKRSINIDCIDHELTAIYDSIDYCVNISATIGGNVNTEVNGNNYHCGDVITLVASPISGYHFTRWNDSESDNQQAIRNIVIQDNRYCGMTAEFQKDADTYTLTLKTSPSNGGSLEGGGIYKVGTEVTFSAAPNNGYCFEKWSDGNIERQRKIIIEKDITLTAYFNKLNTITLYSNDETMGIAVLVEPLSCESNTALIRAEAKEGYHFSHWSDNDNKAVREIMIDKDTTLIAYFDKNNEYPCFTAHYDSIHSGKDFTIANVSKAEVDDEKDMLFYYITPADTLDFFINNARNIHMQISVLNDTSNNVQEKMLDTIHVFNIKRNGYVEFCQKDGIIKIERLHVGTIYSVEVASANRISGKIGVWDTVMTALVGDSIELPAKNNEDAEADEYGYIWKKFMFKASDTTVILKETNGGMCVRRIECVADTTYTLILNLSDELAGIVTGAGIYHKDEYVHITAKANDGWYFVGWSDGDINSERIIVIDGDITLTAYFSPNKNEGLQDISINGNILSVNGHENEQMQIYTPVGQLIYNGNTQPINLPQQGVFIIRIGSQIGKVMIWK